MGVARVVTRGWVMSDITRMYYEYYAEGLCVMSDTRGCVIVPWQ